MISKREQSHLINSRDKYGRKLTGNIKNFDDLRDSIEQVQRARTVTLQDVIKFTKDHIDRLSFYYTTYSAVYVGIYQEPTQLERAKEEKSKELASIFNAAKKKCPVKNTASIFSRDQVYEAAVVEQAKQEWKLRQTKLYKVLRWKN